MELISILSYGHTFIPCLAFVVCFGHGQLRLSDSNCIRPDIFCEPLGEQNTLESPKILSDNEFHIN